MNNQRKTKAELIQELKLTRTRVAELVPKQADEGLHDLIEIIQLTEHVSTKIHGLVNEAKIYRIVKEEFAQSKRYTNSIVLLTDDNSSLRIAEISLSPAKVKAGEKATRLRMKGYKIDLKKSSIYRQVVREGKTVQVSASDIIGELFPRPLARLALKALGVEKESSILTPLKRHGKIIGAFALTSPVLAEHFIPTVRNLAQHISNALEWADEYGEHERAEEELRESEEKYRTIFENVSDSITYLNKYGTIIDANDKEEIFGRKPEEIIGKRFAELGYFHVKDIPKYLKLLKDVITGKKTPTLMELEVMHKDGHKFPVEMSTSLVKKDGKTVGFVCITRDITARKRAQEALQAERDKLKQIFKTMDDGVYIVNQDYDIEYVNPILIADNGPCEGRKCYDYFHDREEACPWCKNQDVFAGKTVRWEWYSFKNGKTYDLIDTPMKNVDGTISKLEIFRDITDRKRLEAEMLRSAKLESLGVMAGGLAHDFNNFLASIMLNVGTARLKAGKDEEIRDLLQAAEQSIQKAKGITQQLLTFTRGGEPVKSSTSLPPIIKESVKFTLHGSKTIPRFDLPEDLWPVEIDPGQINQAINSLTLNAVQAMPKGGRLWVTARNVTIEKGDPRTALQPGNYVEVAVKDEGVGIPPDIIASVFDPYYTTREGGTGLGLFSVYSIIGRHGGWITVESEVEQGTTFTFCLPAAAAEVEVITSGDIQKGSGRVLIMDDDDTICLGMTALLGELGYEVETTADGEETLERYTEALKSDQPFDAVILDLTVPGGMGGAETIERLKALDPRVRAVVSSGYSTDPIMANYQEYGFKAALPKPFQPAELSRAMDQVFG